MKKIYEDIKKVFESRVSFGILCGIGIVVMALIIFSAGITVGFHKASFGHAWSENYGRNFGMIPDRPILGNDNFPNSYGAIGKIIKIELPTMIVQDKDNAEKVILLTADTKIQQMATEITPNNLSLDEYIVVIGSPNDQGQIEAKFIRIMPLGMPPPLPPPGQAPAPIK